MTSYLVEIFLSVAFQEPRPNSLKVGAWKDSPGILTGAMSHITLSRMKTSSWNLKSLTLLMHKAKVSKHVGNIFGC